MGRGLFITIEGGEGGGKSTLRAGLADALRAEGRTVVETREPGGTPGAEALRALLVTGESARWTALSEAYLVNAARTDHLERVIRPALGAGAIVLCDRFNDSTMAYQGYAGGLGRDAIEALDALTIGATRPDLTFILDVPPQDGLARAAARRDGEARFEGKAVAFHEALRAAFLDIAAREPERCRVLDARQPADAVFAQAIALVRERLS
jgi:dTMP kinase